MYWATKYQLPAALVLGNKNKVPTARWLLPSFLLHLACTGQQVQSTKYQMAPFLPLLQLATLVPLVLLIPLLLPGPKYKVPTARWFLSSMAALCLVHCKVSSDSWLVVPFLKAVLRAWALTTKYILCPEHLVTTSDNFWQLPGCVLSLLPHCFHQVHITKWKTSSDRCPSQIARWSLSGWAPSLLRSHSKYQVTKSGNIRSPNLEISGHQIQPEPNTTRTKYN